MSLQRVGLFGVLAPAGLAPDISATAVSVSVMLSITSAAGAAVAAVARAPSVGVDIVESTGLTVVLDFTDLSVIVGSLRVFALLRPFNIRPGDFDDRPSMSVVSDLVACPTYPRHYQLDHANTYAFGPHELRMGGS